MHHAIHRIKRELSICQSLLCHILGSFHVLSQIKPQAPLLVVPIRPCLIFMINVLSALPGFRPRLSKEILCIAKLMSANCSAESPAQHTRRTSSIAHVSNTCNAAVARNHVAMTGFKKRAERSNESTNKICSAKWRLALRAMALLKLFIMDLSRS